jgi:hypothetical protein
MRILATVTQAICAEPTGARAASKRTTPCTDASMSIELTARRPYLTLEHIAARAAQIQDVLHDAHSMA